jgi:hypothetical protein
VRAAVDRLHRGWDQARSELPLHRAWICDSLGELLQARAPHLRPSVGASLETQLRTVLPGLVFSLAVALLAVLILVPVIYRRQAQAQIAANAAPIPHLAVPLAEPRAEPDELTTVPEADSHPTDALAQADPASVPEPPAPGPSLASKPTVTASTTPRYDFDLDHGIPMPPDARGGKPAY